MAELGAGPHRSGAIAELLGREASALGPMRAQLIHKGMIWNPNHDDTAFTVPLFDGFMHRACLAMTGRNSPCPRSLSAPLAGAAYMPLPDIILMPRPIYKTTATKQRDRHTSCKAGLRPESLVVCWVCL